MAAPLFTSFFTPGYAAPAAGLVASLDAHGLPRDVRAAPAFPSWQAATHHKPTHLLAVRERNPGRAIVWLDADARVARPPELFERLPDDFAAYWHHGQELFSGTLYFAATAAADRLLAAWRDACAANPEVIDQQVLTDVLASPEFSALRTARLPASYCHLRHIAKGRGCPVIEQGMASNGIYLE